MSSSDYVEEFIDSCTARGITSVEKIKSEVLAQMEAIDIQLLEADKLRPQKSRLVDVLKHLGGNVSKPKRRVAATIADDSSFEDLDALSRGHIVQICNHLHKVSAATPRELMQVCNVNVVNDSEIYSAIKWLCNNGIAKRNSSGEINSHGPNWANRPVG